MAHRKIANPAFAEMSIGYVWEQTNRILNAMLDEWATKPVNSDEFKDTVFLGRRTLQRRDRFFAVKHVLTVTLSVPLCSQNDKSTTKRCFIGVPILLVWFSSG